MNFKLYVSATNPAPQERFQVGDANWQIAAYPILYLRISLLNSSQVFFVLNEHVLWMCLKFQAD